MHKDTYVIIPVYNEEPVIKEVVHSLEAYFSNIICIDDGSTDNSAKEIAKTNAILLEHADNKGQGAALRTGIQYALRNTSAEHFVTFDADGQHQPLDAVKLVEGLKQSDKDIILGSRFLGEAENMSVLKKLVLKLAIAFTNKTTGIKLTDAHNGLRVFNRNFAEKLRLRTNGMAHASEIIYRIAEGNFTYSEMPVTIRYSDYSKAKGQSIFGSISIIRELRKQDLLRPVINSDY